MVDSHSHLTQLSLSEDVVAMVDAFYANIRADELLGPVFDDIMQVDWEVHLPRMYAFWETVLFQKAGYKGNPVQKHLDVNRVIPLDNSHFERWLAIFRESIQERFYGAVAEDAIERASTISAILMHKCDHVNELSKHTG